MSDSTWAQLTLEYPAPEHPDGRMCNRCSTWKPADGFYMRRGKLISICRACISAFAIAKKPAIEAKACEWCGETYMPKMRNKGRFCSVGCQRTARERGHGVGPFRFAVADGHKRCVTCNEWKHVDEFNKRKDRNMAPLSSCRICIASERREWQNSAQGQNARYLREYGVTFDWYQETLASQNGVCAICWRPPDPSNKRCPRLVVDHDHKSGKVRGLVCHSCNTGMGRVGDDPARLRSLVRYLVAFR